MLRIEIPDFATLHLAHLVLDYNGTLAMGITQGLLETMVANTAPAQLRGTAYGVFNLVSSVALLAASGLAGLLRDRFGASFTFIAGAAFSALALAILARGRYSTIQNGGPSTIPLFNRMRRLRTVRKRAG